MTCPWCGARGGEVREGWVSGSEPGSCRCWTAGHTSAGGYTHWWWWSPVPGYWSGGGWGLIDWFIVWLLIEWFIIGLVDWLTDWLISWSADWLIDWLIDWEFFVANIRLEENHYCKEDSDLKYQFQQTQHRNRGTLDFQHRNYQPPYPVQWCKLYISLGITCSHLLRHRVDILCRNLHNDK